MKGFFETLLVIVAVYFAATGIFYLYDRISSAWWLIRLFL
jgi:hypothetical protein